MAIKRYFATADNTITNAFKTDLVTRGTGSNMGQADILEVFSIYGQSTSASVELSRVLINFPISDISTDRTNSIVAASGSVKFFLKMCHAESFTSVPRSFKIEVAGVNGAWEEGHGLDMAGYLDETKDNIGSNWVNANGNNSAATLVDAIDVSGIAQNDKFTMTVPTSAGGDGVTYTFLFDSGSDVEANEEANTFGISLTSVADDADCAAVLIKAINGTADNKYKYGAADLGAGSALAAGTLGLTAKAGSSSTKITLTMTAKGVRGNVENVLASITGFENDLLLESAFTGGDGPWIEAGADFYKDSRSIFSQTFDNGLENLEIDVTPLVEQWINSSGNVLGSKTNHGFLVKLSGSFEGYDSATNLTGATKSYYTKKFFARSSDDYFKRPVLEARWDSSRRDHRGNFFYSSSLAPAADNLNTIYLYNYIRGRLANIPGIDGQSVAGAQQDEIYVSIFSGSSDDSAPFGPALKLSQDGTNVALGAGNMFCVTGGYVSTGIYSASFAFTGSENLETIYDVWWSGSEGPDVHRGNVEASALDTAMHYHTGAISPKHVNASNINPSGKYVVSMPKMNAVYGHNQTERFRLYVRNKNWSPNIYSVAQSTPDTLLIESASYQVIRTVDNQVVIDYGTGSNGNNYSMLSYDVSGNYFDFDMSLLEPGYTYAFKYSFYEDSVSSYRQQPYLFKFKVEKDEY